MIERIVILAAAAVLFAGTAQAAAVTVRINDVGSAKGEVLVQLCDKANFLKTCAYRGRAQAARGTVVVKIPEVPPGSYAAMAFHDENGDRQMNQSRLGIPTEGGGFSRDAMGDQGPPTFEDAAVDIRGDATIDVNLSYF